MDEKQAWEAIAASLDRWEGVIYPGWQKEIPPILHQLWVEAWRRGEDAVTAYEHGYRSEYEDERPAELDKG